ncbi:MAG: DinB family protein [Fimbriimonadaceae bacterium]|nr:DinB family protein [Fimbriimonadaceae bacterium]
MAKQVELATWLREQTEAVESMRSRATALRTAGLDRLNAPVPGHWSALGCLEHVTIIGRPYEPVLTAGIAEAPVTAPDAPVGYRAFAGGMIWASGADGPAWIPPPPQAVPDTSARTLATLDEFDAHLAHLRNCLSAAANRDLTSRRYPTPSVKLLRLTLIEMLGLLIGHAERHLRQAERAASR